MTVLPAVPMSPVLAFAPVLLSIRPWLLRDAADARPALSGPEETVDAGRFRVHFTRRGVDAPPDADIDRNGLPDTVDTVARTLPKAEAAYAGEGWRSLADDQQVGGSGAIDVYVRDLPVYGYATPVPSDEDGASCFLEIDSGVTVAGSVAESVVTHELHHCVEFRYRADGATWLYEAAATYEQYSHVVDPLLGYAAGVLYVERLGAPDRRLADVDGRFEYAAFLWMKYWSERDGFAPERLPALWEAVADGDDWRTTLDAEGRAQFGAPLDETFLDFATWNAFACANDVGKFYRPDPIPCVASGSSVPITPWGGELVDLHHAAGPFTAAYLDLPTDNVRTAAACSGQDGLRVAAVALDADGSPVASVVDTDGVVLLPTVPGGTVRLVVAGTNDAPLDAACIELPATSSITGCSTAPTGLAAAWTSLVGLGLMRRRTAP